MSGYAWMAWFCFLLFIFMLMVLRHNKRLADAAEDSESAYRAAKWYAMYCYHRMVAAQELACESMGLSYAQLERRIETEFETLIKLTPMWAPLIKLQIVPVALRDDARVFNTRSEEHWPRLYCVVVRRAETSEQRRIRQLEDALSTVFLDRLTPEFVDRVMQQSGKDRYNVEAVLYAAREISAGRARRILASPEPEDILPSLH